MLKQHRLSACFILLAILCVLASCDHNQADVTDDTAADVTTAGNTETDTTTTSDTTDDENVLRIVTDNSGKFLINDLVKELISDFEDSHPDISVELEILPDEVEERNIRLESLRAEIMSGDGPDVFLFPTKARFQNEPVFLDVTQSMYNGMFADISELYDADAELNKEQLQSTVMDAGVIDGARYVLPLWFSYETILLDSEKLASCGIDQEEISGNIMDLYQLAINQNDKIMTDSTTFLSIGAANLFSQIVDYKTNQIMISPEEIAEATKLHYQHQKLVYKEENPDEMYEIAIDDGISVGAYVSRDSFWRNGPRPMLVDNIARSLEYYVISKVYGYSEMKVIPLRASDGSVAATVTYWGAISAGCDNVELAYEFMRSLLSEKAQWEIGRAPAGASNSPSFYGNGYPVRIHGSVENLTTTIINMGYNKVSDDPNGAEERFAKLKQVVLTDADFPLLNVKIDCVRFPILWESDYDNQRYDIAEYNPTSVTTDVEIDKWAKELVRELEFHIAEG